MAKIELTEKENSKLKSLMAQGMSMGEALIKMGKAVAVNIEVPKDAPKVKKVREVKIDPVKDWLIGYVETALSDCVDNENISQNVSCVLRDGTKKIDLTINGESYSLTLTKKRVAK